MSEKSRGQNLKGWFRLVGTIALVIFIGIAFLAAVINRRSVCGTATDSPRQCALEKIVERIITTGDCSDIALQSLSVAQHEVIRAEQEQIRAAADVRFRGLPTIDELRYWCYIIKHQYQYSPSEMQVSLTDNGEFEVMDYGTRVAVYNGALLHVYTSFGSYRDSRVIRDCSGKVVLLTDVGRAFKCPIVRVIVHAPREYDLQWARTYDELGFALTDWSPVRLTDLVAPERG